MQAERVNPVERNPLPIAALCGLASALGFELYQEAQLFWTIIPGDPLEPVMRPALDLLATLAHPAWWRDDREQLRELVGFTGQVSDIAEGLRADALRWLAGQGPAVERLAKAQRLARQRV